MTIQIQSATRATAIAIAPGFTAAEWHALRALRTRYAQAHDLLPTCELARLQFLRWLVQTGRLAP